MAVPGFTCAADSHFDYFVTCQRMKEKYVLYCTWNNNMFLILFQAFGTTS